MPTVGLHTWCLLLVYTLDAYCWFTHSMPTVGLGFSFRLGHPWKSRNWPKNYGGSLLQLCVEIITRFIYTYTKVHSWLNPHAFLSALHMQSVDHLNIEGPFFSVKCCKKIQVRTLLRCYVYCPTKAKRRNSRFLTFFRTAYFLFSHLRTYLDTFLFAFQWFWVYTMWRTYA